MLRNDHASSWKQVMNLIQQNIRGMLKESNELNFKKRRKEMLPDEQASSWKKAMNSFQQNGRKEMLTDERASN